MNTSLVNSWIKSFSFYSTLSVGVFFSCHTKDKGIEAVSDQSALDTGEILAKAHCSSCHMFPSPDLLDKRTWKDHILPSMGYRFGIYQDRLRDSLIEKGMGGRIVRQANVFPATQVISDEEWESINKYYHDHAPDKLTLTSDTFVIDELTSFESVIPDFKISRPAVSAIMHDSNKNQLYVADCSLEDHSSVTILNASFEHVTTLGLPFPVSNLAIVSDTLYILMMGHFVPSDEPAGSLVKAIKNEKGEYEGYSLVLKNLKRPVDIAYADLNEDGRNDIVVCEFGNHTGSVSLNLSKGKNKFIRNVLNESPGAVSVRIEDMNNDSKEDIVVLMSQGDEGVDIYFNEGNGQFKKERVLRFPSVYGSASINVVDFNHDGRLDIVYVNGDNADASQILKPYHGIRIFLNIGNEQFVESYFYPLPGAYKAIVKDFDHDGDLDIAAVAFFPDFINHAEKGFVFLDNTSTTSQISFSPSVTEKVKSGRWITLVEADINRDGFNDIVLGAFTSIAISGDSTLTMKNSFSDNSYPLILLRNAGMKKKIRN